ncbi:nitric-oxide synthase [Hamadaea flava]|uniref:Nitric oxide synthase oxygenase n=1 Tax=Hamadaea flava TaxID=1742688 RepID=A0ABV8LWH7_9ACTN|nr:nitric oxide synthase oxygenase [Hamadaea flava]MCP2324639.1 nitric-oxide synthase [Hamadaea flava]
MSPAPGYRDAPLTQFHNEPTDPDEAEDFLRQLYAEQPRLGVDARLVAARVEQVREQIDALGTYAHTRTELVHGARMAWRNSSRCIGRLYWNSLVVRDLRGVSGVDATAEQLVQHLQIAAGQGKNRGRLRPVISIFPQAVPGRSRTVLWNEQLIRYAGYRDGTGDPLYADFTEAVTELGWKGKHSAFDILPLVLQETGQEPRLFELPEHAVLEVPLTHPDLAWVAELGLRWHAVPAISNMRLTIGGVNYPLAPFSGWYMGTEIGARNLADADRYDQLPIIAERLGLDTTRESSLWRDRALVELNRAVLWSFERAGVKIADHHTESRHFLTHIAKEEKAGRTVPADWSWIVPPLSGGATPVFHRYYPEADLKPNFYLDENAKELSRCPFHAAASASVAPPGAHSLPAQRTRDHPAVRPAVPDYDDITREVPMVAESLALGGPDAGPMRKGWLRGNRKV